MGTLSLFNGALATKIERTFVMVNSMTAGWLEWTYVIVKETHVLVL